MLLEGMEGGSRTELLARYGDLGASPGTSTGPSLLVLGCTVHRDDAEAVLSLMAENLRSPTMDATAFDRTLREHTLWPTVARGEPALVAGLGLLSASLGLESPGASLGIGPPRRLEQLDPETVGAFLRGHTTRGEATILMAGDVDEQRARTLVDRALADWPATPEPEPTSSSSPPQATGQGASEGPVRSRTVLVPWPTLPQAFIAMGGPRAPYGHEDEPAQAVASTLLASTLQYELRTRQRSTYAVQSRVWQTLHGDVLQLWVRVDPEATRAAVRAVRDQLRSLTGDRHFSEQVVAEVRTSLEMSSMLGFHGPEATLGELVRLASAELPADTPQRRLAWLRDVDARRVAEVIEHDLADDRWCWCVAGDPEALRSAGAALPEDGRLTRTPEALLGLA